MTILFRNVLKTVMEMCGNLSQLDQNWHGNKTTHVGSGKIQTVKTRDQAKETPM